MLRRLCNGPRRPIVRDKRVIEIVVQRHHLPSRLSIPSHCSLPTRLMILSRCVANMRKLKLLESAKRRQEKYWKGEVRDASTKLAAAVRAEKHQSKTPEVTTPPSKLPARTPFERFVRETMGSRDAKASPMLFMQANIIKWQFLTPDDRARFK